jgi:hypothetical protein
LYSELNGTYNRSVSLNPNQKVILITVKFPFKICLEVEDKGFEN